MVAEPAGNPAAAGTLLIDANVSLGQISPYVYGTNYGPWSFVPLDLMPLAIEGGISYLRFPGGDWGDENDITELQLDNFITLTEQLGAEPAISVRLHGGSPETAVELVRYANIEQGYDVNYWSIGNEPELYGDYDTVRYNEEWRAIADAMLEVDPEIILIGPDVSQFLGDPQADPRDANGKYWIEEFLRANGDLVDIVSIHRYPFPTSMSSGPAQPDELRANLPQWDSILANLKTVICRETGRSLPIAITEFNSHWNAVTGGEGTPDSHFGALWLADVLGRAISSDVEIVAQFALQSASDNGGWGLFSRTEARPSYYVYRMYQLFGDELVHAASGVEDVSVYAAKTKDNQLAILVINLREEDLSVPILVTGGYAGDAEIWLFDSEHSAEQISSTSIVSGSEVFLPAESISVFVLSR